MGYLPEAWPPFRTARKKKAAVASGPKFREETPKKGNNTATLIAVLYFTRYAFRTRGQVQTGNSVARFLYLLAQATRNLGAALL